LHPFNLMLYLAELDVSFEEAWPEIEDTWVEAVRSQDWHRFGSKIAGHAEASQDAQHLDLGVTNAAAQVIEKLWRGKRWGRDSVRLETLRKHYCRHVDDLESAIDELVRKELLLSEGKHGPYSLNSKHKQEIDRIANVMVNPNK
jgi:hypothetical protein